MFVFKRITIILTLILLMALQGNASEKDNSKVDFKLLGQIYQNVKDSFFGDGTFERITFLNGGIKGAEKFLKEKGINNGINKISGTGNEDKDVSNFEDSLTAAVSKYSKKGINEKELLRSALEGMIDTLNDPYTVYMDPAAYKRFNESMGSSDYSGIGIFIEIDERNNNQLTIIEPIEDSPAYKAGLKPGDQILEIDGKNTKGIDGDKASKMIKGQEGSAVVIKITRKGASHPIEFEITRKKIHLNSIVSKIADQNIGLIRIRFFGETTGEEFKSAAEELESQGVNGIIIDLRNNGGGYVDAAIEICSYFIPKGQKIVTIKEKSKEDIEVSKGFPKITKPIILLVNGYSASASEITSGALQDYGIATLVGDKTFGKGCVQSILDLKNNGGALKITIAKYFTPKGRKIHHIGLTPDIKCPMDEYLVGKDNKDIQMKKAIELMKSKF